ncbi:cytochrome B561 [Candidatus Thiomargarita nelsonii]|uniref:Cytochrome B561 n=1 Tax=Candidatus Thiomargarita nelsonii TaxID=1003181 RepID=A0A176S6W1_9GAMM|nr:cytochrome B561 [Candidatus Thiomargarita nelsonii]
MLSATDTSTHRIRIWDLPTRLFHWLLVCAFILAWLSQGDDRYLEVHVFSGYLFLGLLGFRVLWGLIGSHYAQLSRFAFGWRTVWEYLKTLPTPQRQHFLGHNPAGSWAVFAILGLGLFVSLTGLLALGGEERHGPFAGMISFALGEIFRQWHEVTAWLMLGLIGIHIVGVLIESGLYRENLIKAMITGFKTTTVQQTCAPRHGLTAALLILAVLAGSSGYFSGYLNQPYLPFLGPVLPDNALWREECGDCHLAYHPTLLPARSWQRMLAEQDDHFGEDLYLDDETKAEIHTFLVENAAESGLTEAAWKINRSTPPVQSPLRLTETPFWREQHQNIADEIWQHFEVNWKGNCGACHLDAEPAAIGVEQC